jgi:hypothetical protein
MRRVNADVAAKKAALAHHQPAAHESKSAQDAAVAPPDDKEAQGKVTNSAKMDAAKPGAFDKAAFIRAVNDAIAAQAPKNLDDADKFSKSGKAEKIKGAVDGKVTDGKNASAHDIDTATSAPPDTSAAKDKQVVPMRPDQPPANPGAPDAANAAPQPQPAAVTDFSDGPKKTDQQMAAADVTDHQLATSNEPEFTGALKDKKQADAHSASAPGKGRGEEKQQIGAAKSGAAASGAQAMANLTATRAAAGKAVDGGKGQAKSKDEQKRAEVTSRLQKVFDATKKDVEAILSGLDKKVDQQFTAGEQKARAAFEADQKRRMKEYKDKRYGGWLGGAKWAKDKLLGMPKAANDLFQISRQLYVNQMQGVISSVADTIGAELGHAKARIAQGRADLKTEVTKLPADLRQYGQDAAKDFAGKFDDLESEVNDKSKQLVQDLATKYTQALHKIDDEIKKLQDANKGLVSKAVGAIAGVIKTIMELKNLLMGVLAKAASAISKIIKNPIGFLNNLVHAVGAGLKLFLTNIADHLKKGLVSWLLGTAVKAGLNLPSSFDLKGIIQLITSLLGLTWANIRARITSKGIPDQAMTEVEKTVPIAQKLSKEGPAGAEKEIVAEAGDLKATILGKLTSYLIPTVIIAGITWILSLLNPASAFVRAVKAIIDIVSFVINQGAQVIEFVNAVLDAVLAIANGGEAGVPKMVETALAAAIPTLLGLLASLLGIGNLASKVKSVFQAVAKPVNKVIDKVVGSIVKMGKKLWAKLKTNTKDKNKPSPVDAKRKKHELSAAMAEAKRITRQHEEAGETTDALLSALTPLKRRFSWIRGFSVEGSGPYSVWLLASKHSLDATYPDPRYLSEKDVRKMVFRAIDKVRREVLSQRQKAGEAPPQDDDQMQVRFDRFMSKTMANYESACHLAPPGADPATYRGNVFTFSDHQYFVDHENNYIVPESRVAERKNAQGKIMVGDRDLLHQYRYTPFNHTSERMRDMVRGLIYGAQLGPDDANMMLASLIAEARRNPNAHVTNLILMHEGSRERFYSQAPMTRGGSDNQDAPRDQDLQQNWPKGQPQPPLKVTDLEYGLVRSLYEREAGVEMDKLPKNEQADHEEYLLILLREKTRFS